MPGNVGRAARADDRPHWRLPARSPGQATARGVKPAGAPIAARRPPAPLIFEVGKIGTLHAN
jgi:hypothetical protein